MSSHKLSPADLSSSFQSHIISTSEAPGAADHFASTNNRNHDQEEQPKLVHKGEFGLARKKLTPEIIIADEEAQCVAARVQVEAVTTKKSSPAVESGSDIIRFVEHHLCWFTDGEIGRTTSLVDADSIREQLMPGQEHDIQRPSTPLKAGRQPSKQTDLKEIYRSYIECINMHRMKTELDRFCHQEVTHNGRRVTLAKYRELIQESLDAIRDMRFDITTVLVDDAAQRLYARLEFSGTPIKEFAGVAPSGKSIAFSEQVFYQFDGGKITQVWSLVDWDTYREQIKQP